MGDTPQQVNWQNDPDFHSLPLAEKHKVLLQVDPDYKGLPAKEQAKALDAIHYGALGQISGTGSLTEGAGTAFVDTLKGMLPPTPQGPVLSKQFWVGDNTIKIHPTQGGIAQAGKEAVNEYGRARQAGAGPLGAGISSGVVGAGSLLGASDEEQQKLAAQGESGKIVGQSAVPVTMALVPGLAETKVGKAAKLGVERFKSSVKGAPVPVTGLSPEATGAIGRSIGHATHIPFGGAIGEFIGKRFGTAGAESAADIMAARQQRAAAFSEMQKDFAARSKEAAKAQAKADAVKAKADKVAADLQAKTASAQFPGATSTATPIGNAPLPPAPAGPAPTTVPIRQGGIPPPPTPEATVAPNGESGIPTFGKTLYQMGEEPNLANPQHVKILKVLQTRSGPDLRALANQGDRFAAFVLRTMPRP